MPDSIEQKIVARAMVVAALINGSGGYNTTLGSTLAENGQTSVPSIGDSRMNWDQAELPAIGIFRGVVQPEDRDDEAQKVLRRFPLVFRGYLKKGATGANADAFMADIFRAARAAGDKWPVSGTNLAHYTTEGSHQFIYAESYELIGVEVEINVHYSATHLDMEA